MGGFVPYVGPQAPAGKQHPHKVYLSNQPVNTAVPVPVPQEANRPAFNEDDFKQVMFLFQTLITTSICVSIFIVCYTILYSSKKCSRTWTKRLCVQCTKLLA